MKKDNIDIIDKFGKAIYVLLCCIFIMILVLGLSPKGLLTGLFKNYSNSDDNLDNETNKVLETYYSSYVENIKIYEKYKSCNSLEQVSKAYKALSIANELANDFNNYVEAHKNELNPEMLKEYPLEKIS